jgi:hypothetical protein
MEKRVIYIFLVHLQQGYETFHPPTRGLLYKSLVLVDEKFHNHIKTFVLVDEKFHNLVVNGQKNIYKPLMGWFSNP